MTNQRVGLIGARSLVGKYLIPLLQKNNLEITAFSRRKEIVESESSQIGFKWKLFEPKTVTKISTEEKISTWICMAPIWALSEIFQVLEDYDVKRIVVLSSTSLFTKEKSTNASEQNISTQITSGEESLRSWAESKGIEWVVLRPTLIYDGGLDKNISEIVRFIRLFGFFPVFGKANGLRQPIYAGDVAAACVAALQAKKATNKAYNISGSEVLSYRKMVQRIFIALEIKPRVLTVPLWFFSFAVSILHLLPRYRKWTTAMAERMNIDMIFDHSDASKDLDFSPRPFELALKDFSK
ncbi:MAG: NAD-dependent epimerase/dehydratase family protein [Pseudobdellovibrio sp.]